LPFVINQIFEILLKTQKILLEAMDIFIISSYWFSVIMSSAK